MLRIVLIDIPSAERSIVPGTALTMVGERFCLSELLEPHVEGFFGGLITPEKDHTTTLKDSGKTVVDNFVSQV